MKRQAFTLVEVVVALGIAAGALVLLISANHAAMQRSMRAHERVQLVDALETKAGEIRSEIETQSSGEFPSLPGWTWNATREKARFEGFTTLDEITLKAMAPGHSSEPARTMTIFKFVPGWTKK